MTLPLRTLNLALALALPSVGAGAADLIQAYDLARQSDPQLGAADATRLAQGEGVVQARANLLPQISGSISYAESERNSQGTQFFGSFRNISDQTSDANTRQSNLRLTQSLYDHSNYTTLRANRARADQATADYDAALQGLMVRVSDAYFAVLTAIETLASTRAEERSVQRQLEQAEKRLEVGLAPITDVHDARARYDSARANTIASQNAYEDALEALAEVTGKPLAGLRGLGPDFRPSLPSEDASESWVKIALENNPVLRSRELALAAARHDIATARAGHLPTLTASIDYGDFEQWGDQTNKLPPAGTSPEGFVPTEDPFNLASDTTTVGVQLNVPLFAGFATRSRVRQAVFQRDAAEDQAEQERRAVVRQARNAYRALVAGIAEVEARRLAVVSATSALEATEAGFEVGTRTIVDVLISQQQLFDAQRQYAAARNGFVVNSLRLKQSAGVIALTDLKAVNGLLVADAEAQLDESDGGMR